LLADQSRQATVLDIGCSSGILLSELQENGFPPSQLYGVDISDRAIAKCHEKGLKNTFQMDAQEIVLEKRFDIIIASDCLEHLADDEKALQNWYNLLKPGGLILVFVPAFQWLWSHHDEVNHHYRRYLLKDLKEKMQRGGFQLKKCSYWNFSLLPAVYLSRKISAVISTEKGTGDLKPPGPANALLYTILKIENQVLRNIDFPFGVSAFCIATR
jgi:SAM-dependent methyltransferase